MKRILSLTHTNPLADSRILKAHEVVQELNIPFLAVGINRGDEMREPKNDFYCVKIRTKKHLSKIGEKISHFRYLRILLMFVVYIEAFVKILIKGYRFKPTVIHVNDWYVLPIAFLIKNSKKVKIIYDAHELESETNGITNDMRRMVNFIEKRCWRKINFFITVSPSIADWYKKKYNIPNIEIVMNSPKMEVSEVWNKQSNYFRDMFSIPETSTIFLYLGNLERGRGISESLKAFSSLRSDQVIVFMGSGSLEKEIKNYVKKYENIFIHKPVPHNQVTQIASSADVGICLIEDVSLSDYFCLPNKLFEYVFAGLPVIASKFPDMSKVIMKYGVGVIVENSAEGLVDAVSNFDTSSFKRENFSYRNLSELSWERQSAKLKRVYEEMLA